MKDRPLRPLFGIEEQVCCASNCYFERGGAGERRAWEIAGGEAIAEEDAEYIAACCVAVRGATAVGDLATYELEGSHGLDFGHQEACHPGPFLKGPCLEACRCWEGDDASDQVAWAYVAVPLEREPCYFEEEIVVCMPGEAFADSVSVVSEQACRTGCWA